MQLLVGWVVSQYVAMWSIKFLQLLIRIRECGVTFAKKSEIENLQKFKVCTNMRTIIL